MLDTILNTLMYYFIKFSKSSRRWRGRNYCYTHFINKETRARGLSDLPTLLRLYETSRLNYSLKPAWEGYQGSTLAPC